LATPIGTGENLQLRQGFYPLISQDLCGVLTPDLQKAGGLAEGKKIADLCQLVNKPLGFHMMGSPLALMASCHLAMAVPYLSARNAVQDGKTRPTVFSVWAILFRVEKPNYT
jgi:L-alanine-DL-glutamate epimerase-like enolase superfamily enzyme